MLCIFDAILDELIGLYPSGGCMDLANDCDLVNLAYVLKHLY